MENPSYKKENIEKKIFKQYVNKLIFKGKE